MRQRTPCSSQRPAVKEEVIDDVLDDVLEKVESATDLEFGEDKKPTSPPIPSEGGGG